MFFFQAEDGIRDLVRSRGLGDVYKRQDLMGRMGRAFYVRASGAAILTMPQSQQLPIVGYPNLPEHIKSSSILTANVIGALSGMKHLPSKEQAIQTLQQYDDLKFIYSEDLIAIHNKALELFNNNQLDLTAAILMSH
mgnify:CR=1 FL=1